jgi:outer membrane protein OmpA-like peptidoglycan-associated protein
MKTATQKNDTSKQASPAAELGLLQRKCDTCGNHTIAGGECKNCGQQKGLLQRKDSIGATPESERSEVPAIVHEVLSFSGHPLDTSTRAFFEPRFAHNFSRVPVSSAAQQMSSSSLTIGKPSSVFEHEADRMADAVMRNGNIKNKTSPRGEQSSGLDLSGVRIHTGSRAAESARAVNAHAYTVGNDIVFGEGQFSPRSSSGRRLIAHELTHVLQQSNSSPVNLQRSAVSNPTKSDGGEGDILRGEAPSELAVEPPAKKKSSAKAPVAKDPNCGSYEPGEIGTSHGEPGHLSSDIERLDPTRLLIADFGVEWRHVKNSVKKDPALKSWLDAWERDDSYRLTITGYSDCVGAESLNGGLRESRASNMENVLGPAAKTRVTSRGAAGPSSYVTTNDNPANRARNRGVVIGFHREFTFPEETIIGKKPSFCGPESADWLVSEMATNRNHPVIRTQREVYWPNYVPFFNLGWNYGALTGFRDLVKAGAIWDYKSNQKQWRSDGSKTCPSIPCDKTVTLCGKCFFYDVPGNIHFGYIGRQAALSPWFLHNRASAAQKGGVDPPEDVMAIDIGIEIADKGTSLCDLIATHENELNRDGTKDCAICKKKE